MTEPIPGMLAFTLEGKHLLIKCNKDVLQIKLKKCCVPPFSASAIMVYDLQNYLATFSPIETEIC
jgi:hypothetical protein